ncbi:stable inheritance protein KleA [Burkholderia cenocepacia]|uniref:stable inheritance protein KleA n=1 Tax=Burkholderia cenocepacia TaxID=95486 RepID=UPI001F4B8BFA|nr:stable inheritance protein KleA [Burkholderia cenocepacia]
MSKNKIMPWVDALPNVEATDFQARRDQIEATMAEAAEAAEAAELVKQAEELRGKAYFAALSLEASAKGEWSSQAVEQAKRSVGW